MEDKEEYGDLMKRIRFKPLQYDVASNYDRLQNRLQTDDIPLGRNIYVWKWSTVAASITLLIVSSLYFTSQQPAPPVWYETTAVPDAKTRIILPDSSAVWLNANASLRHPRAFDGENRTVGLSGEAFFEVRKGEAPFIVDLGKLHVKVLGTSFNVITDEENDKIIITLIEGKIALYDSNKPEEPKKILTPENQAVYSESDGGIIINPIRPESITSWITGEFRFDGNTLSEIVRELERAFHVKIHIENESMQGKTFNAVFEDKETLDEILSILQISAKYTMVKRRGEIYLR